MAKWLDRLKSCFGRKAGEIVCATAAENTGRPVAVTGVGLSIGDQQIVGFAPKCTVKDEVETFTPKVGQLMLDKWQILTLLQTHGNQSAFGANEGWFIWNNKKQKYQPIRSKPMVAINHFLPDAHQVSISLYGVRLFVREDQLQFK